MVFDVQYSPREDATLSLMDCHTHGLKDKFNQPEVQLVFPTNGLPQELIGEIFHNVVRFMKRGRIQVNRPYSKIIEGLNVRFELIDDHLRIILPDKYGSFDSKELGFKTQRVTIIEPVS